MNRLSLGLVAAIVLPSLTMAAPATAAPADNCTPAGQPIAAPPWPQQMLQPERAWPFSTGSGVTVAVIDSGVDAAHPQLRGHVTDGIDLIEPAKRGLADCAGHGTQVAGIIAAQSDPKVGFHGVARDATIVSARVSDQGNGSGASAGAAGLARAIDWAAAKARVINISMVLYVDDPGVRTAIANARARDVVVVAAAGNEGEATDANLPPYPAAYNGVIGVGAIGPSGARWQKSPHGPFIDLVAPGESVVTTQRVSGLTTIDGTSAAAAFVSATAALIRGRWPTMSAAEVGRRLTATAAPTLAGADSEEYGNGVVDPYAAVSAEMAAETPQPPLPGADNGASAPDQGRTLAWSRSTAIALALAAVGTVVALCVAGLARALPMGRRRRWNTGLAPAAREIADEEPGPPAPLFDLP
jgi:type VII secretion-associated serine protease mycosin